MGTIDLLFWLPLICSFVIVTILTPLVIQFAKHFQFVDDPQTHKHAKVVHTYPVPRLGGIPIYFALLVCALIWLPHTPAFYALLAAATLNVIIGLIDDRWDISPYTRLSTNLLSAVILVSGGTAITYLTNPWGGVIDFAQITGSPFSGLMISLAITAAWVAALMNMIGIGAGGIEGQLPGVVAIAAIFIAIFNLQYLADPTQWPLITLAAITAGSFLGLIPWNFFPQKIMPGYSGKSLAGFLLAAMAILTTTKMGVTLIVLGLPIADACIAFIRRILSGRAPFWGDRGHLHHKLLDNGLSKSQIVIFYWAITALFGIIALRLNSQQKAYTLISIILVIGLIILLATRRLKRKIK